MEECRNYDNQSDDVSDQLKGIILFESLPCCKAKQGKLHTAGNRNVVFGNEPNSSLLQIDADREAEVSTDEEITTRLVVGDKVIDCV